MAIDARSSVPSAILRAQPSLRWNASTRFPNAGDNHCIHRSTASSFYKWSIVSPYSVMLDVIRQTPSDPLIEDWVTSMGVTINTLHRIDGNHDKHLGSVTHNGHTLDVVLVGPFDRFKSLLRTGATAEYELNEIISADSGLEKNDTVSGMFPLTNDQIAIDGTIHNETKIDDYYSLLDIYIQNGADFLAVTSEDLGHKPLVGGRIRIVGKGLNVYPTFT